MTRSCIQLKALPKKDMSQAEAEKGWAKDMTLYNHCRSKHAAYVKWVRERDSKLMGK